MKHRRVAISVVGLIAAIAAMLALPGGALALNAASTFDSGDDNWTLLNTIDCSGSPEDPAFTASGGNPGGYISGTDNEPGSGGLDECIWAIQETATFSGNMAANYGGTLSYDLRTAASNSEWGGGFALFDLGGNSIQVLGTTEPPAQSAWTNYSFELTENEPGATFYDSEFNPTTPPTQEQYLDVLNDVQGTILLGDLTMSSLGETTNFDNVVLTEPTNPPDGDGDGVPDSSDDCPATAGPAANDGCPVPDGDGDGVPDASDNCPGTAGPASNGGCPVTTPTDSDGDGVADASDNCPAVAGPATNAGCPVVTNDTECEEARAALKKAKKKLRKLKQNDAPASKIKKAKKRVKKAKKRVEEECGDLGRLATPAPLMLLTPR